jgi:hypothetical protein
MIRDADSTSCGSHACTGRDEKREDQRRRNKDLCAGEEALLVGRDGDEENWLAGWLISWEVSRMDGWMDGWMDGKREGEKRTFEFASWRGRP